MPDLSSLIRLARAVQLSCGATRRGRRSESRPSAKLTTTPNPHRLAQQHANVAEHTYYSALVPDYSKMKLYAISVSASFPNRPADSSRPHASLDQLVQLVDHNSQRKIRSYRLLDDAHRELHSLLTTPPPRRC